ncbi:MAG: ureidoglycolate lyase [Planctomycetota bacterium]|nr:ureidoglycolate lyase [Planctomycetota bacterium]
MVERSGDAPDYLNPDLPPELPWIEVPIVEATAEALQRYGRLVDQPDGCEVEIVRWPAQGWRPVDQDSGDEGGTTEGIFLSEWKGDVLYGQNEAVGGHYVLGYADSPEQSQESSQRPPEQVLLWHANYHPDGGQLFFPLQKSEFLVPLALPGDDVAPADFVAFRFTGSQGLYIHPGVWHEGVYPISGRQRFFDKQGAVHARVSVDFAREFSCLLRVPLRA